MDGKNLKKIVELRHELHAHPELSMHEGWTKRRLMDFIGANTTLAVVDCGGWFYASRYREGTPAVAFRADMDALPIRRPSRSPMRRRVRASRTSAATTGTAPPSVAWPWSWRPWSAPGPST